MKWTINAQKVRKEKIGNTTHNAWDNWTQEIQMRPAHREETTLQRASNKLPFERKREFLRNKNPAAEHLLLHKYFQLWNML